ncbi:MAG: L-sulfolactate dehydrogenase [Methanobacteriaceae archaeon]|nr:L-sulfolactate dehydrogenase [Methanobacteriaceae archaeon]
MKISIDNERKLIINLLEKYGAETKEANVVADVIVDGDLKGFSTHGLGRFPQYIKSIEYGTIKTDAEYEIESETVSAAIINGNHKFGQYVTVKGMDLAVKKAQETGIGVVGIHDSNHYGIAGYYADIASIQDMIGIVISNTEPAIAPFGGKKALLGTNPITISVPSDQFYICVDMATSVTARGKLLELKRKGEELPEGMALDSEGKPTTNPEEGLNGSILPFGGFKGYALAFMFEILAGPLVKAAYGEAVKGTATPDEECTKGDLLIAINPDKLGGAGEFKLEVDDFVRGIKEEGGVVPGDREMENIQKNRQEGIPVDETLYQQLKDIANKVDYEIDKFFDE